MSIQHQASWRYSLRFARRQTLLRLHLCDSVSSFMPLFNSSSGFQVHGGNFYEVAGDMNIHGTGPPTARIRQDANPLAALESDLNSSRRQLLGADRNARRTEAARTSPYGRSRRPPLIESDGQPSSTRRDRLALLPPHSSPLASSLSQGNTSPTARRPFSDSSSRSVTPVDPESWGIEYSSEDNGELTRGSRDRYSTDGDRDPSDSDIVCPPLPADRHRTSINISGNVNQIQRHGESGLHILHRNIAGDAFHDSAERYPQPKCHPETRTEMHKDLWKWSFSGNSNSSVLWLHGPAGAGKSAIAQSFCQKLEEEYCLGASFFFKRGDPSRGAGKKLFPTLAYQLALCLPKLKKAISEIVEADPSIVDRDLSTQLQKLIIKPCRQTICNRSLVVVIDGLDECEGQNIQQEILRSINTAVRQAPLPLRFFVASRPEPHIREIFVALLQGIHRGININQSFEDVQKYLLDEFARIHREHCETMATVPFPWPAREVVEWLVRKSSGYFIFASTIIKFIDDKDFRPTERLKVIMGIKESDGGSPFAALDQLYTQILSQVKARPLLLRLLTIMGTNFQSIISGTDFECTVSRIEQLLQLEPGDVKLTLRALQSLVYTSESGSNHANWRSDGHIFFHHASFHDFLQDPQRAGIYYIGSVARRHDLSCHIIKAFSYNSRPRMCGPNSNYPYRVDNIFKYAVSSEPSTDLITLLYSFNPVFLFRAKGYNETTDMVIDWLKVSGSSIFMNKIIIQLSL
ncbi:hypothetical protein K438DRAFT_699803 [Mycena galopus ATCC 62051]|nr:hypothetical protein K438DRAFT_699803 [Mycena galopus ATCC 62051]